MTPHPTPVFRFNWRHLPSALVSGTLWALIIWGIVTWSSR